MKWSPRYTVWNCKERKKVDQLPFVPLVFGLLLADFPCPWLSHGSPRPASRAQAQGQNSEYFEFRWQESWCRCLCLAAPRCLWLRNGALYRSRVGQIRRILHVPHKDDEILRRGARGRLWWSLTPIETTYEYDTEEVIEQNTLAVEKFQLWNTYPDAGKKKKKQRQYTNKGCCWHCFLVSFSLFWCTAKGRRLLLKAWSANRKEI